MTKNTRNIILVSCILATIFGVIIYEAMLLSRGDIDVPKNSLQYHLTFPPRVLKKAPEVSSISEVRYQYCAESRDMSGYYVVYYTSNAPKADIEQQIEEYLNEFGYSMAVYIVDDQTEITNYSDSSGSEIQVILKLHDKRREFLVRLLQWNY